MRQEISVLMDGELDDKAAGELIEAMGRDHEARETWRAYHLIGDALRERAPAAAPAVVAPRRLLRQPASTWYALAASLAAVAFVGWFGFAPQQAPVASAPAKQVAQAKSAAVAPATKPATVPLPSGTNDYLLAHQGFSPRLGLQGMAPYVLTVSEQGQEPGK